MGRMSQLSRSCTDPICVLHRPFMFLQFCNVAHKNCTQHLQICKYSPWTSREKAVIGFPWSTFQKLSMKRNVMPFMMYDPVSHYVPREFTNYKPNSTHQPTYTLHINIEYLVSVTLLLRERETERMHYTGLSL